MKKELKEDREDIKKLFEKRKDEQIYSIERKLKKKFAIEASHKIEKERGLLKIKDENFKKRIQKQRDSLNKRGEEIGV